MKQNLVTDIRIYEKFGGFPPEHTIGWKFKYDGIYWGNYISDLYPVKKNIALNDQIELFEKMVETMRRLRDGLI